MNILIFGKGYLAQRCKDAWGDEAIITPKKVFTVADAEEEILTHKPDVVFNAAGITGKPNVDWCEDHPRENMLGNAVMPILLAEACQKHSIYLLHMGSGCIFYGDRTDHDPAWAEDDFGNPSATYSRAKYAADLVLSTLPNVGIGRIRMPIDSIPSERNLIDKLASYPKIIDVENSVTVIEDMIDVFYQLLEKRGEGIFHVTNPGTMKHRDLIALYQKHVDSDHSNEWITEQDLVAQGLATKKRSNNILASSRLGELGIVMRHIDEALEDTLKKYAEAKRSGQDGGEGPDVCAA